MQYNNTTMTNTVKLVALLMHAASAHKETDMKEGLRMTIDEMREKKRKHEKIDSILSWMHKKV